MSRSRYEHVSRPDRPQTEKDLYNQSPIDSYDMHVWQTERQLLLNRVSIWCKKNKIKFTHYLSPTKIQHIENTVIVCMLLFDMTGNYEHWKSINQHCQQHGKKVLVVTDNIVEFDHLSCVEFFSYPELLGITASYSDNIDIVSPPSKLYNCFIQRVCSMRQSWFYFLHHHNLLDKGYVSVLMRQLSDYSELTGQELFDFIHHKYQLDQLPHFEKAYQELRSIVPYRNFTEVNDLLPLILDSKYSLVLETYAVEDDTNRWCFTEKSLRSIQFPNISLLFLQKHGIAKLRALGFEFDSAIDKIDDLPWQQRQQQLLQILVEDSIDFDSKTLYNQSQHNRQLLKSWKTAYNNTNFFDNFFEKATSV